jgi:hypothetical protein
MKVKQVFALGALCLATGAVLAQEAPLSRAEVVQSVLAARADGTLRHAGEAGPEEMTPYKRAIAAPSTVTHTQEKASVLQARAEGTLPHAGSVAPEEEMAYAQSHPSVSTLTRAEVKADVLEARAEGTLIPAGQGEFAGPESAVVRTARNVAPAHEVVAASTVK